jgi:hypothetical protein
MKSFGVGWVIFIPTEKLRLALGPCIDNTRGGRDQLVIYKDGSMLWRRPPRADGRGVADGRQQGDFDRVVARAIFGYFSDEHRKTVRSYYKLIDSGWARTMKETERPILQAIGSKVVVRVYVPEDWQGDTVIEIVKVPRKKVG